MKAILLSLVLASGVSAQVVPVPPKPLISNPTRGQQWFATTCQPCHTRPQGFDLAHFVYQDTTMFRRTIPHVPNDTIAWDVIAHINSLPSVDTMNPMKRPFQPGNVVLANDSVFGVTFFGSDQWPLTYTRAQLKAVNGRTMKIALPLGVWSDEASTVDWLPGTLQQNLIVPPGVMAATKTWIDTYNANKTVANAIKVSARIRNVAHDQNIPDAPCLYSTDLTRYNAALCADVAKWSGTFLYVAGLEMGNLHSAMCSFSPQWWEVGHLFHKAQQNRRPLPSRDHNIAWWMHIGWFCDYAPNKASSYESGPLNALGQDRLATVIALKTMVERRTGTQIGSNLVCDDANVNAQFGSKKWMINSMRFAYKEIQYRAVNRLLNPNNDTACINNINLAQRNIERRMGASTRALLQPLADSTIVLVRSN